MLKHLLVSTIVISSFSAKADIVVRGKAGDIEQGGGNTTISCKGRRGECMRIINKSVTVFHDDKPSDVYTFESYKTEDVTIQGEPSTKVILIGAKLQGK